MSFNFGWPGYSYFYYLYPYAYYPYVNPYVNPYGTVPNYNYPPMTQPQPAQSWYYCSNPPGYYPYVQACNGGWQQVPATPPQGAAPQPPQQ